MTDDIDRRLTQALHDAPDPPRQLLDRILGSRAAGMRTALPLQRTGTMHWRRRLIRRALAAAAAVVLAAVGSRWLHPRPAPAGTSTALSGADMLFAGELAFGQVVTPDGATPRYGPLRLDPSRLRSHRLTYVTRIYVNDKLIQADTSVTTVERDASDTDAWMVIRSSAINDNSSHVTGQRADTLWIDAGTLASPRGRIGVWMSNGTRASVDMTADSSVVTVHERVVESNRNLHRADGATTPLVNGRSVDSSLTPLDTVTLRTDTTIFVPHTSYPQVIGMFPSTTVLTMTARFEAGARGSAMLIAPLGVKTTSAGQPQTLIPLNFSVVGSSTVTRASGTFDCWKVRGGLEATLTSLVRKNDGVVVSEFDTDRVGTKTLHMERELVAERSP